MSQDVLLGTPFNVGGYSLLTHLVAHELNMEVGDYVHSMGDVHIYSNQLIHARQCLELPTFPLPKLKINRPVGTSIFDIRLEDLEVVNYVSGPRLKIPVSI